MSIGSQVHPAANALLTPAEFDVALRDGTVVLAAGPASPRIFVVVLHMP